MTDQNQSDTTTPLSGVDLHSLVQRVFAVLEVTDGMMRWDVDPEDDIYSEAAETAMREALEYAETEDELIGWGARAVLSKHRGNADNEIEGEFRRAEGALRDALNGAVLGPATSGEIEDEDTY